MMMMMMSKKSSSSLVMMMKAAIMSCVILCVVSSALVMGAEVDCATTPQGCVTTTTTTTTLPQIHGDPTCIVTEWSAWSECSTSCGEHGLQQRIRKIESKHTATECGVPLVDTRQCNVRDCPRACKLTQWSEWSTCSLSCGGGQRVRVREVEVPANGPQPSPCGPLQEVEECGASFCDGGCEFSNWSNWTACSAPCGSGEQSRSRTLKSAGNSAWCGETTQVRACNTHLCPVDCVESTWSAWGQCSQSCGRGYMSRTRTVERPSLNGGVMCNDLVQHTACNDEPCPSDCVVGEWHVENCPERCDNAGTVLRTRKILQEPLNGGHSCPALQENVPCSQHCHSGLRGLVVGHHHEQQQQDSNNNSSSNSNSTAASCLYSNWTSWTPCHGVQCGNGATTTRTRTVLMASTDANCTDTRQEMACEVPDCAANCQVSEWSEWSTCSDKCGAGKMHRTRTLISSAVNGGRLCPSLHEVRDCNTNDCLPASQQCTTPFTEWSPCSASCGGGVSVRYRPAAADGSATCGYVEEKTTCHSQPCVDWRVSEWSAWSECNAPCNGGLRQRTRTIEQVGTDPTVPSLVEVERCNAMPCHPPVVTEWSEWSECNKPCGGGTKVRVRNIYENGLGPYPAPVLKETAQCNVHHCPVDCTLSTWSEWSVCDRFCKQQRARFIETAAQFGGAECSNKVSEQRMCTPCTPQGYDWSETGYSWAGSPPVDAQPIKKEVPTDCHFSTWSEWTPCDSNCAQSRQRTMADRQLTADAHLSVSSTSMHHTMTASLTTKCGPYIAQTRKCPECRAPVPTQPTTTTAAAAGGGGGDAENQQHQHHDTPPSGCGYSTWSTWETVQTANGCSLVRTRTVTSPAPVSSCNAYVRQRRACDTTSTTTTPETNSNSNTPPNNAAVYQGEWSWDRVVSTPAKVGGTVLPVEISHPPPKDATIVNAHQHHTQTQQQQQQQPTMDLTDAKPVTIDGTWPAPTPRPNTPTAEEQAAAHKALNQPIIHDTQHTTTPVSLKPIETSSTTTGDHSKATIAAAEAPPTTTTTTATKTVLEKPKHVHHSVLKKKTPDVGTETHVTAAEDKQLAEAADNKNVPKALRKLLQPKKEPLPPVVPEPAKILTSIQATQNTSSNGTHPCALPTCECKGTNWTACTNNVQSRVVASVNEKKQCVHTEEERPCSLDVCASKPCQAGYTCVPDQKWCLTTPCPQYKCVLESCEYKTVTEWSACQPACACMKTVCGKFKRRIKKDRQSASCPEQEVEKAPCGTASFLEVMQARHRRALHTPTTDLESFNEDINMALAEEHKAEHLGEEEVQLHSDGVDLHLDDNANEESAAANNAAATKQTTTHNRRRSSSSPSPSCWK